MKLWRIAAFVAAAIMVFAQPAPRMDAITTIMCIGTIAIICTARITCAGR